MCATGWPKSALAKKFSPIGPVVPELWPNMWGKSQKKEREGKSPQNDQKIKENWPLLRNYWSKLAEIWFGIRFEA